jgi:predicted enzyme related to lactoylglutathione lyase
MAINTICHIEIAVPDAHKAGEFYKALFGWEINNELGDDYLLFQPEEGVNGAFATTDRTKSGFNVVLYVKVDDIEGYLEKAEGLGAHKAHPRTEIPNYGWYAHFIDPYGNTIGLFTPFNE